MTCENAMKFSVSLVMLYWDTAVHTYPPVSMAVLTPKWQTSLCNGDQTEGQT